MVPDQRPESADAAAFPHGSATLQVLREDSIVMIDDGCTVEGYQSDITRTFVLGKASDKMKHVSTGGGAFLEYVEGTPFPALAQIEDR